MKAASWLLVLAGLWLIMAPFVLGTAGERLVVSNDVLLGIIVAILGLVVALQRPLPKA